MTPFWPSVVAACLAISAELSTDAIFARTAASMRELSGGRAIRVFDASRLLRVQAGGESASADEVTVSIEALGTSRGFAVIDGPLDATTLAGLDAIASQAAVALGHAAVYEELEGLVAHEMAAAVAREEAIQLVLDSMGDGLLVCELTGRITPICSKIVTEWFGALDPELPVWEYLGDTNTEFSEQLRLSFEQIASDILPFEVSASVVPKLLRRGDRAYTLRTRQVMNEGVFSRVAITVTDVTQALAREKAASAARELPEVVGNLLRDRDGFDAMIDEMEQLLVELAHSRDPAVRARVIHTLKGNGSIWGFASFARVCHDLEDTLEGDASALLPSQVSALSEAWQDSVRVVHVFRTTERGAKLHVSRGDHCQLLELLARREDHSLIANEVSDWTHAPMRGPFDTLARQAERLAENLGKQVTVIVEAAGRMPMLPVPSLVTELTHVVRNALDHGIESADERIASGKAPAAVLRLSARSIGGVFEVTVEDDGRGVDWAAVRARAIELGHGSVGERDAHEVLFASGFSTVRTATVLSGRGVGMSAVREAFRKLGGDVHVESSPGRGTRVVCRAPLPHAARVAA